MASDRPPIDVPSDPLGLDTPAPAPLPMAQPWQGPVPQGLERDDMAWPPAPWERAPTAWRDDVWSGPGPFQPYDAPTPAAEPVLPAEKRARGRLLREILETGFLTLLIFLGIKLVVQNFKIQGASMEPTLHDEQFLLVNKVLYQLLGDPQRGDIVVFEAWQQGSNGEERDYIKRVIGVPGDTIEIRDNLVLVNNQVLSEPYLDDDNARSRAVGPIVLGSSEYFVMGDNRDNSSDSRDFGPLEKDRIIGKAWLSYWPPGDVGFIPDAASSFALGAGE